MTTTIRRETKIHTSARVMQARGIFDVQPAENSIVEWTVDIPLPDDWQIGLIVGASGAGKSTIASELYGDAVVTDYEWSDNRCVLDDFPERMSIRDITTLLSRVGFASPPSWLRPYRVLSTGERFRVRLARALAEDRELVVMDEFTSVVDRQVAQIGCHCVQRVLRRKQATVRRFIGVSCHYDIIDWLQPDWLYEPAVNVLTRREVQRRPDLTLTIRPVGFEAWHIFAPHHYLTRELHHAARCYVGFVNGRPAVFDGLLSMPHAHVKHGWRSSRRVTLPDFQGLGLGPIMGDQMGSLHRAVGRRYFEHPTHPSLIRSRAKDKRWRMTRPPSSSAAFDKKHKWLRRTRAVDRWIAGFEYVGPAHDDLALARGMLGVTT